MRSWEDVGCAGTRKSSSYWKNKKWEKEKNGNLQQIVKIWLFGKV